jgi:hypothetical protein
MKIKGKDYWALICDCGEKKKDLLICGVYSSRAEAKEAALEIRDCPAPHRIKKCRVTVEI